MNFTKMHGAGNDFIVIDCRQISYAKRLSRNQLRALADRRLGIGADQILMIETAQTPAADFRYRIFNANGEEVEHCGNGARCFAKFVYDQGLTKKKTIRAEMMRGVTTMTINDNNEVCVAVSIPSFTPSDLPFLSNGFAAYPYHQCAIWPIPLPNSSDSSNTIKNFKDKYLVELNALNSAISVGQFSNQNYFIDVNQTIDLALTSLGNPHASILSKNIVQADITPISHILAKQDCFPAGINIGFFEVIDRSTIHCRVYERGAGETLACGTGACAAVITGIKLGLLDAKVSVLMPGGKLIVEWDPKQNPLAVVYLTGPAVQVYSGHIDLAALN